MKRNVSAIPERLLRWRQQMERREGVTATDIFGRIALYEQAQLPPQALRFGAWRNEERRVATVRN